jgi:DNA polymerase
MNMRTDEDYLREMELWSLYELSHQPVAPQAATSVVQMPRPAQAPVPRAEAPQVVRRPALPPVAAAPSGTYRADPAHVSQLASLDWDALAAETTNCTACGLCKHRKQAVFGVGAKPAPWLFIGEGPGAEEDEIGQPFVGQAGKLLDSMLKSAGLERGREVYIANVVKCRPPGNRTPTPDEAAACAPFLDRQIDLIQPKLIVALGKTAVTRLTGSDASMASLRGRALQYRGIPVVATYHPAYLLRNLPEKLKAWEDLMFAQQQMTAALAG